MGNWSWDFIEVRERKRALNLVVEERERERKTHWSVVLPSGHVNLVREKQVNLQK